MKQYPMGACFFPVITVCLLLSSFSLYAEEAIGVVDWRRAIFQSNAAQKIDSEMKSVNKKALDRARELEGKLETSRKKLAKDRDLLSESALKDLEINFQRDVAEFNVLRSKLQEVQVVTENQFIVEQKKRVDTAMIQLAKKYKLTLVLDKQSVVYGRETRDLTQELTNALDSSP